MAFSFGFSGDDIEFDGSQPQVQAVKTSQASSASAFPVAGKPQLPPTYHPLPELLSQLPSKVAFGCLDFELDNGASIKLPRRELWDVRVQLMAEDGGDGEGGPEGLGEHDVKTGVYEGGFKSWESSVDLVKVLAAEEDLSAANGVPTRIVELGCGTALPSLAMLQWASSLESPAQISFIIADYNPTVLQLVTLPNFILAWALSQRTTTPALQETLTGDEEQGQELELTSEVLEAFQQFMAQKNIHLSFLSGAWSSEFVDLMYGSESQQETKPVTLILGAETIYSPFALNAFTETIFNILERERNDLSPRTAAYVAAKRLYFGVGGSLDDFVNGAQERGAEVVELREEAQGVRRGVVRCSFPDSITN